MLSKPAHDAAADRVHTGHVSKIYTLLLYLSRPWQLALTHTQKKTKKQSPLSVCHVFFEFAVIILESS